MNNNQMNMMNNNQMNMMNNNQMNMMNNNQMNNNMNNNNNKTNANVNQTYDFIVHDPQKREEFNIKVQGNNGYTIEKLIKGFKVKLCNDDAVIKEYKLNNNMPLSPDSKETLAQKGIDQNQKIHVYMQ